jgi:hypothetical protein
MQKRRKSDHEGVQKIKNLNSPNSASPSGECPNGKIAEPVPLQYVEKHSAGQHRIYAVPDHSYALTPRYGILAYATQTDIQPAFVE